MLINAIKLSSDPVHGMMILLAFPPNIKLTEFFYQKLS
jgi:hypothetical protein